jgi:hypothetical protein
MRLAVVKDTWSFMVTLKIAIFYLSGHKPDPRPDLDACQQAYHKKRKLSNFRFKPNSFRFDVIPHDQV